MNKRFIIVEHITLRFNRFLGTSHALMIGLLIAGIWTVSLLFKSQWHSSIIEIIAIVSFLNIFTVQRAQNKDLKAIHIKLDELIASSTRASNRLISAEEAPEHVLDQVQGIYKDMAKTPTDQSRMSITSAAIEEIMDTITGDGTPQVETVECIINVSEQNLSNR